MQKLHTAVLTGLIIMPVVAHAQTGQMDEQSAQMARQAIQQGANSEVTELARGQSFRLNTLYQIRTPEALVFLFIDADGKATLTSTVKLNQ